MSMSLQGYMPTLCFFVLQKSCTLDNLISVSCRGVRVISPYNVLTILFVLFRLPVLGESGETKSHLQRRGQPPHLFEQQYWAGSLNERADSGWLAQLQRQLAFLICFSLFCIQNFHYIS